ncbi:M23 family metallopeptidase [Marinivivus vitaminiproducens]|uniref:M23 family metallopeptidase n=1 Tax=Marinivivus vitaminiproducens TaxID=3035935 RepID=UPI00279D8621|nr:M23 family metallopeptidase [Geminicoccaceae bacterium SCSIO 64248]
MSRHGIGFLALLLLAIAGPADAATVELQGVPRQGGLVFGQTVPGSTVTFAGRKLLVTDDGRFVIGFDRDAPSVETLNVRTPDGHEEIRGLAVAQVNWPVERVDGLPPATVTPQTPAQLSQIRLEGALINGLKRRNTDLEGFLEPILQPVQGRISGVFGSQRILNGEPRAPHRGMDIAAPTGTPVHAMASGTVILAQPDMYYTGNTVFLDHGHGLLSVYAHLDTIEVAKGDTINRGQELGTLGASGRATGPHLHWGIYWFERAVDPADVIAVHPAAGLVEPADDSSDG